MIPAGFMRTEVLVERLTRGKNSIGELKDEWTSVGHIRVFSVAIKTTEGVNGREQQEGTRKFITRYPADLVAGDRLRIGSRVFDVLVVSDVYETHRFVEIVAKEVV